MKLYNQTIKYVSISIIVIVSIWSAVLYFALLDEIYDSIDDGLDNYKILILQKSLEDTNILHKHHFEESNYAIRELETSVALAMKDQYNDTLMYMHFEDDLEPVRMLTTAFEQDEQYYELKIIASMVEEDDLIRNLLWFVISLFLVLILSFVLINSYWVQRLWKPFYTILGNLKQFNLEKDKTLPKVQSQIKEFRDLQATSENLVHHWVQAYHNQKQFTENAAHELQTPLAIASGKLELLLENGKLKTEDAAVLAAVLESIQRMTRLNQTLLTLSKIENKQYYDNRLLDLNILVKDRIAELADFAHYKGIQIELNEKDELQFSMDRSMAIMLFQNLIKNAIIHSPSNAMLTIFLTAKSFVIENAAIDAALDESKIFTRFYKDAANAKNSGLGLAIVQSIVKLYALTINYSFYENRHRFEVQF